MLKSKSFLVVSSIIDFFVKTNEPFDKEIIENYKLPIYSYFKDLIISDKDYELIFNFLLTHRLIELDKKSRFKMVEPLIIERFYFVFCEDKQIKIFNYGIQKLVRRIKGFENIDKNHLDLTVIAFYSTIFNHFGSFHNFPGEIKQINKIIFKELLDFEDSNFSLKDDFFSKDESNLEEEYVVDFQRTRKNTSIVSDIKHYIKPESGISKYTTGEESIWDLIDSDVDLGYLEDDDSD